jgi:hypothetical protein
MRWILSVIVLLFCSVAAGQNFQIRPFPGEEPSVEIRPFPGEQPRPLICLPRYEWRYVVVRQWYVDWCGQLQQRLSVVRVLVRVQ